MEKQITIFDTTERLWGPLENVRRKKDKVVPYRKLICDALSSSLEVTTLVFVHLSDIGSNFINDNEFMNAVQLIDKKLTVVLYSGDPKLVLDLKKDLSKKIECFDTNRQFVFYPRIVPNNNKTNAHKEFETLIAEWQKGERLIADVVEEILKDTDRYEALVAFRLLLHLALLKLLPETDALLSNNPRLQEMRRSFVKDDIFWKNIWKPFPTDKIKSLVHWFDTLADVDKSLEEKDLMGCMQQIDKCGNICMSQLDGYLKRYLVFHFCKIWKVNI